MLSITFINVVLKAKILAVKYLDLHVYVASYVTYGIAACQSVIRENFITTSKCS